MSVATSISLTNAIHCTLLSAHRIPNCQSQVTFIQVQNGFNKSHVRPNQIEGLSLCVQQHNAEMFTKCRQMVHLSENMEIKLYNVNFLCVKS